MQENLKGNQDVMDIGSLRKNTPGVENVIHFNNAGAALPSKATLEAQLDYLSEEALWGGYETGRKFQDQLLEFYSQSAALLNAEPSEMAYVDSATTGWQRAFFSVPYQQGDEIITSESAYESNYISYLQAQKRFGIKIVITPSTADGEVNVAELDKRITARTKLVAITHIPTSGGLVNPAEAVGEVAEKHGIPYLLDACQSVGQYPVDVKKIRCTFLSSTGRKFLRAPRGTGLLYVSKQYLHLNPFSLDLFGAQWLSETTYKTRQDSRKFETWECNLANKLGMIVALKELNDLKTSNVWERIVFLANHLRKELEKVPGISVHDQGRVKSGIVTFTSDQKTAVQIQLELQNRNINTSVTAQSGTLLNLQKRNLDQMVRASIHYYNTLDEIDQFIIALRQIVSH